MATTYVPIQTIECSETTSTILFSNIPQDYTDLVLRMNILNVGGGSVRVIFNNDNNSNYHQVVGYQANGGTFTSNYDNGVAYFTLDYFTPSTTRFTTYLLDINSYTSTTLRKAIIEQSGDAGLGHVFSVGLWRKTPIEPITSIRLEKSSGSFAAGSTATIYGIKTGSPKALGGDIVTLSGGFWYHAFLSSGTFEPQQTLTSEVLVVAGGGGGGYYYAGGGGAGGLAYQNTRLLNGLKYVVQVGAGGTSPGTTISYGGTGGNSVFDTITANGGGGGGMYDGTGRNGLNGGSGGGGGMGTSSGGTTIGGTATQTNSGGATGYGNNGGGGLRSGSVFLGGGGGGAGAVGGTATGTTAGSGGAGLNTWSTWATATSTGASGFYAGGGGGGAEAGTAGNGGSGGGGRGATWGGAGSVAGSANTGGGGGGSGGQASASAGGSGIVIVRYAA